MAKKSETKLKKGLPIRVGRRLRPDRTNPKIDKYARYRQRVGKPNGRGVEGNKAGKNKSR